MLAVTAYPIGYAIYLSLQRYDLRFPDQARFVGLSNYGAVLSSEFWWEAFWVTLLITVVSVAVELVLGFALALVMHRTIFGRGTRAYSDPDPVRHRHRGRRLLLAVRLDPGHRLPRRSAAVR